MSLHPKLKNLTPESDIPRGHGEGPIDPRTWYFATTEDAWNGDAHHPSIKDGDVLIIIPEKVIGVWSMFPFAATLNHGELLPCPGDLMAVPGMGPEEVCGWLEARDMVIHFGYELA